MGLPLGYEAKGYFDGPKVIFRSFISRQYIEWIGRITRTSGSIDSQTRLVYAYAEVMNPYDKNPPLAIGTYVDAEIEGNFISGGFIISNAAIKNENEIYIIASELVKTCFDRWSSEDFKIINFYDVCAYDATQANYESETIS